MNGVAVMLISTKYIKIKGKTNIDQEFSHMAYGVR